MNLGLAILIVIASTALAVGAMVFVRRKAPDGSYFHDGDRAAGVFGVLATGFAVLIGSDREAARSDRIHGAIGVIPTPLWYVLFLTSALIFVYMLFFADSGEPAIVQGMMMATVVAVVVSLLLLLQFLDNPFHTGVGGLHPDAMRRTLLIIDQELTPAQRELPLPCDARGSAV